MTYNTIDDEQIRMRQFWVRVLLVLGMLWGGMPFITVPLVLQGAKDSMFDVLAAVFNGLTVLPACALAFWHRRIACVWLTANALVVVVAIATWTQRTKQLDLEGWVGMLGAVVMAVWLDYTEIYGWPGALARLR